MVDIRPPLVDFSPLGQLPNAYFQGRAARREQDLFNARRDIAAGGPMDFGQMSRQLLAAGDLEGGLRVAGLANQQASLALQQEESTFNRRMREAELGLKRMDLAFKRRGGFEGVKDRAQTEAGLRKEFSSLSKDYRTARDAYARVQASASDPSAAGDLALVFNYMKVLDPLSVVREGEFATAQNASGVPERVRNVWNRALSGERLGPEQRADFVDRAGKLFAAQDSQHTKLVDQFSGIGSRLGVDIRNVVPDFTRPDKDGWSDMGNGVRIRKKR